MSENFVTVVEKLSFKDLYLTRIDLSRNEISKIEPGAFENCVNITLLDLSHNKLENISKYSFDSATYATELQLSYNQLTSLNQVRKNNSNKMIQVEEQIYHRIPSNERIEIIIAGTPTQHDGIESSQRV